MKNQLSVNAYSNFELKSLNETIKNLTDKVENKELKQSFGKQQSGFQGWQKESKHFQKRNQNFGKNVSTNSQTNSQHQKRSFGNQQNLNMQNVKCTACGNPRCTGLWSNCQASEAVCFKCEKVGHFSRFCRSIYNTKGQYIKH